MFTDNIRSPNRNLFGSIGRKNGSRLIFLGLG